MNLWAGQWYSHNKLDGIREYILYERGMPALFKTRRECRTYIKEKYGYIKDRKDLREEPYGWRLPRAVKVELIIKAGERDETRYNLQISRSHDG